MATTNLPAVHPKKKKQPKKRKQRAKNQASPVQTSSWHLLRFFLFCFVYLCLFIIFRSESWRCHFDSLLFDSYCCHIIDSQHCRSTDSQHSHTHSAATLVQYIQWTVLQIILQLVFNRHVERAQSQFFLILSYRRLDQIISLDSAYLCRRQLPDILSGRATYLHSFYQWNNSVPICRTRVV